ncbi:MAG: TetR/AcrR family transcriptional regulator [Rhodococcus sp.]|nr:TetR/AcrR family transcriptional regulator [Rhodococcus sp. (in: high G+C Gram-positive bacteria)]
MPSRDELRENTRRCVLESAERLFRERGFKAAAIRDIADDAGVSVGSVMSVGDKRELLVEIFDKSIAKIHQQRSEERAAYDESRADAPDSQNPADRLMAVIAPFLGIFAESPDLAREYGAILMSGSHQSQLYQDLAVALLGEISATLTDIGMSPEHVPVAAKTIYFSYLGGIYAFAGSGQSDFVEPLRELYSIFTFITETGGRQK